MVDFAHAARLPDQPLWAITTLFNPVGYRRRLHNYRVFRRHLPIPLLTVELSFERPFELREGDAEILLQRRATDVMWHKERLLNLALDHLPPECEKVIWIDCDMVYLRPGWPEDVLRVLDDYPLAQGFRRVIYLARDADPMRFTPADVLNEEESMAFRMATNSATLDEFERVPPRGTEQGAKGFVWAARREVIESCRLYDACIIGGGDRAFMSAAYGRQEAVVRAHFMGQRRAEHYLSWAESAHRLIAGRVGYLDADVLHLWHGDLANRGNGERHQRLASFAFDPFADVAPDLAGCWRWSSPKPELHAYLRSYFASRKEDG